MSVKFIPYTQDNMFLWYEGNDPDRATPFNGVNLNLPLRQLELNDEKLDETIQNILSGDLEATKLITVDIEIKNNLKLNTCYIKNSSNDIYFTNENNENNIILNSYSINVSNINLNTGILTYNNSYFSIKDTNGNLQNIETNILKVKEIDYTSVNSKLTVVDEDTGNGHVDYLDFKSDDGYDQSFIRSGSFYAINSYYNFGSKDLQDAIVYDDQDDSETANTFLFYADGKVENSTIMTGDVKTVGADIAEYYNADKKYDTGIILEIGGEKEVTEFNGGPLAGVVSENPGYTLNQNNTFENPVLIALKGRVKVKIIGEAKKGQYIVAYKNGIGKAKDKVTSKDQVVGIALENGSNEILIKV